MSEMPAGMLEDLIIDMLHAVAEQRGEHVLKTTYRVFETGCKSFARAWHEDDGLTSEQAGARLREVIGNANANVNVQIEDDQPEVLH